MADTNIEADPIILTSTQVGNRLVYGLISLTIAPRANPLWGHVFVRHPELDITFNCGDSDKFDNEEAGIIKLTLTPISQYLNITVWSDYIEVSISSVDANWVEGIAISEGLIELTAAFGREIDVLTEMFKRNWIKWSNIGSLDFTIWKDNIAGERPLDWPGWVYMVKKLGKRVVAYGENGVSILTPSGVAWGLDTIYRLGLKGRQAIAGDEITHFFIDKEGKLFSVSESFDKLDYSEYLSNLSNPVLSWDPKSRLLYICDGTLGFIYSQDSKSLGKGPVNITGIGYQGGTLYPVAPIAISTPAFEVWSDIYDLGSREGKTIEALEIGTDFSGTLKAAVKYRQDKSASFRQTDWATVNEEGVAFIQCYGQEFQFGAKSDTYEYFELDYIKAIGRLYKLW